MRQARTLAVQFVGEMFQMIIGLADRGRVERVGFDQIGTGVEVGAVHGLNDFRLSQRQQIVVALEVAGMAGVVMRVLRIAAVSEAFAAITAFVQFVTLQHGTHCTIDDQDALRQRVVQFLRALGMQPGQRRLGLRILDGYVHAGFLANKLNTSNCGGLRSRVMRAQLSTFRPALSASSRNSSTRKPRLR